MTTKTKKEKPLEQKIELNANPVNNIYVGLTEPVLRAIGVLAATQMLAQPQFAFQANQAGLVELSDVLFKYMTGAIQSVPTEGAKEPLKYE